MNRWSFYFSRVCWE